MRRRKAKGRDQAGSQSTTARETQHREAPAPRGPEPAPEGGSKISRAVGVLGFMVVVALSAAVVILSIALSDQATPAAELRPDAGPAEATAIDQDTWLVTGEIDPDDGLFICEKGVDSATSYGNDLIVICRE